MSAELTTGVAIQRRWVRFPARRPWSCIFRNWSRFGSYNVYLNDTRISYTLTEQHSDQYFCLRRAIRTRAGSVTPRVSFIDLLDLLSPSKSDVNSMKRYLITIDRKSPLALTSLAQKGKEKNPDENRVEFKFLCVVGCLRNS